MNTGWILADNGIHGWSDLEWPPDRLFLPEDPQLPETTQPSLSTPTVPDSLRSYANNTTDIALDFSEAVSDASLIVGGTATGWTISVNGVNYATTYRSGSGTAQWVLRAAAALAHSNVLNANVVRINYSSSVGATVSTSGSVEITDLVRVPFSDQLTKHIRFLLCDSADTPVVETVKAAAFEYDSGVVANTNWMLRTDKQSVTTDALGQFDMTYTGSALGGDTVYVAVVRTTESLITTRTVV